MSRSLAVLALLMLLLPSSAKGDASMAAMENVFLNKLFRSVELKDRDLYLSLLCTDGDLSPRDYKNNRMNFDTLEYLNATFQVVYRIIPAPKSWIHAYVDKGQGYEYNLKVVEILEVEQDSSNALYLPLGVENGHLLITIFKKTAAANVPWPQTGPPIKYPANTR